MFVIWIFVTSVICKGALATHDISRIPTYVLGPKPTEAVRPAVNKAQNRRVYETVYTAPTTTERPLNPRYGGGLGGGLVPNRRRDRYMPQVDRNRERAMQRVRSQTTPRPTTPGLGGGIALEPWFRAAATSAPRRTWDQPSYNQRQQQQQQRQRQSNSNPRKQQTPTETSGVWREADMYRTKPVQPTQQAISGLLAGMNSNRGITALYSYDHGPGHDTAQQHNAEPDTTNNIRSRFKVLPNGSLVDYGTSSGRRRRKQRPKVVQPTGQPTTTNGRLGVGRMTTRQTRPRTTTRNTDPVGGGIAIPGIVPTAAESRGFAINDKIPAIPISPSQMPQVRPTAMLAASTTLAGKQRGGHGSRSRSGSRSHQLQHAASVDDPGYWETLPGAAGGQRRRVEFNFDSSSLSNRSFLLGETLVPRTTRPPTTTTTIVTTTTIPTTTTPTTTTTTTTQKPIQTTSKWGFNGGEPVNITYLHDQHVCPASRARWQDYTVYLETKPRLCMIQITWNARYKQEPIYHKSWWGQDVEWVYKTVYDPEVNFVDLHHHRDWRG